MSEGITRETELIVNLYQARKEKAERKAKLVAAAEEFGQCDWSDTDVGSMNACYRDEDLPRDKWCQACTRKQPARERYHAACGKASGALRSLLAHGKKIAEEQ